ncbi:MAG: hydrogen gas-evolving membrane-bound hydrogenase subunit E [Candidatus Brocadiia bacterium]
MDVMTMLYLLISFMIIAAVVAVEARDLLSTVISVSAAGAALSIVFLLLGAPDLAITQVVVEILCLVLLIRATVTRTDTTYESRPNTFATAGGLVFCALLCAVCFAAFRGMVPFGQPRMLMAQPYLLGSFGRTGAANAVMGVLLDFRAYDTLGEATVIFTSIIGAYVLLRHVGRKPDAGPDANR